MVALDTTDVIVIMPPPLWTKNGKFTTINLMLDHVSIASPAAGEERVVWIWRLPLTLCVDVAMVVYFSAVSKREG